MLRIIGGQYRSRKLFQPPEMITRPTKDRVREAIFSSLGRRILDACVLDLFAGSGAYGLEAYSRGARDVHFNDHHALAITTIQKNLDLLAIKTAVTTQLDYLDCLRHLSAQGHTFHVIFLDPPYDQDMLSIAVSKLLTSALLNPGGVLVIEYEKEQIQLPEAEFVVKKYNYGRTNVLIGWKKT